MISSAAVRARIFSFLASLARYDFAGAFEALTEGMGETALGGASPAAVAAANARAALAGGEDAPWSEDRLRKALEDYRAEHGAFRLDPEGRASRHTVVEKESAGDDPAGRSLHWRVSQLLQDHDGHNDWKAVFAVDLEESRKAGIPVLRLTGFSPTGLQPEG